LEKSRREIDLKIEQTEREIKGLEEQRRAQSAKIEALRARLKFLIKERNRREILYKDGLISLQSLEVIETEEKELGHQIEAEKALLRAIEEKLEVLKKNLLLIENERLGLKSLKAQLTALSHQEKALQAQRDEANLYLSYSQLKSPFSGYIAKKFHNEGDVIAPGEPIYALVDPESFYLLVLLEENKLKGVVVGARAKIKLDAYPDKVWKGEVETILPASAATFALVPRDISAGEFTKLSQRIPVKIRFTEGDRSLLRVGLSGKVEIERKIK
ncbi:MAG: HlyD family secretion protein, partial [Caldimicrobium sp.]